MISEEIAVASTKLIQRILYVNGKENLPTLENTPIMMFNSIPNSNILSDQRMKYISNFTGISNFILIHIEVDDLDRNLTIRVTSPFSQFGSQHTRNLTK